MANNDTNKEKKGMKGIFIPIEIFENANINLAEKLLYGMIWYYSTHGNGCRISADNLGKKLGVTGVTVRRYRQHLKELNLVRSEGYGERTVYYVNDTKVDPKSDTKVDPTIDNDNEEVTSSECMKSDTKVDPKSDTKVDNGKHRITNDTVLRNTDDTNLRNTGDTDNKELNKELNEEVNNIHNVSLKKAVVNVQSLEDTVDEEKEHSNNENMEKVQLPGYSHFFTDGFEDGWSVKLIETVRDADNEKEVLWKKWDGFLKYLKTEPDISFTKAEQYLKTFRYLIGRIYKEQRANELKRNVTHDFNSFFKHFFLVQWKRFLSNVSELEPADRKKTRLEFFYKAEKVFQGEEYTKTISMMENEGYEAYNNAGLINFKPEDLDPDIKYQNLAEQEVNVTVKEGDELPFSTNCETFEGEVHETVSGSFEKVRRAWKKLIAECYQNKQQMSMETMGIVINKLESMGGTVSEIEELKWMMDDDVEALNRKIGGLHQP